MLMLVFRPLLLHWKLLKAAKNVAEAEGGLKLVGRMMWRWGKFTSDMKAGKLRFVRRLFVRRVQYVIKAWREWAWKR